MVDKVAYATLPICRIDATDGGDARGRQRYAERRKRQRGLIGSIISLPIVLAACSQESPRPIASEQGSGTVGSALAPPPPSIKEYRASDIEWDYTDIAKPYRAKVVAGVNKVLRENRRCADIQTTSLYPAEGFSKRKPVFFVICEARGGGNPFGVTFNVDDVGTGKRFGAAAIIKEADVRRDCEAATKQEPNGLRDISFPIFTGNFIPHDDGRATIALAFTAKNALGIKDDYKALCFFKGPVMTEHNVRPG